MLRSERLDKIKTMFRTQGEVKLKELEQAFPDCSSMTLRRDISFLESQGLVKRMRGGAVAMSSIMLEIVDAFQLRAQLHAETKEEIAQKALRYFEPSRSIFIDAGTTTMAFARSLPDVHCSVLTSGVNIALELLKKRNPVVNILGGQVNKASVAASSVDSADYLRNINIDIAFMGSSGLSLESGLTCGLYTECNIKKEVVRRARKTVALVDSSKVGCNMPFTFSPLDEIDVIVTDAGLPNDMRKCIQDRGIELIF